MSLDAPLLEQLEKSLPSYIAARRWFRAKTRLITAVSIQHVIPLDGYLILILQVHYPQGEPDLYLLPVTSNASLNQEQALPDPILTLESPDGESVSVYDATVAPFFRTVLFRALACGASFPCPGGELIAESSLKAETTEGILQSAVSKAEQSNTTILYGTNYILKLFRKLEAGINPDIEIGAFLTAQKFENTPSVFATLTFQANSGENFSVGILQQFVLNQGDAWKYTLDSLAGYYARSALISHFNKELLGDYLHSAKLLGIRTAQMHSALASLTSDADFTPEAFSTRDAQLLSDEIAEQVSKTLTLLRAKAAALPPREQDFAKQVLKLERHLIRQLRELGSLNTDAQRIRHHGDYHLGQVLYTGSDFVIIDFEGEPARPLKERRAKAIALRDVAGMLRSFQYAAYAALPSPPAEHSMQCADFWYKHVSKIYLDAYFTAAASKRFLPSTYEQRRSLLDAFLLEKALYEVLYELNNRPAWVGIPLRGILSLIEP